MKKLPALFVVVTFCAALALSALVHNQNLPLFSAAKFFAPALTGGTLFAANVLPVHQDGVALSD